MPFYTRTRTFQNNVNPVGGGLGPPITAQVLNEYEQAHQDVSDALPVTGQVYALKRPEDPRAYSLTGGADDSAALQACFDAAGVGGSVELPAATINYRSTLTVPSGMELRGTGMKASVLATDMDIVGLSTVGGEGHAFKNFKLVNSSTGTRTTYDIEICNPFKPVLEHVELTLSQSARTKGGIRLYKDAGQSGSDNCFMPVLNDVWIRNGVLRIADVTDVKVHGGWVWATYTQADGAVELSGASNCTFVDLDIVPSENAGYLVSGGLSNLTVIGGLMDGSYDAIHTGWGFKTTDYIRGLVLSGVKFWHLWLGGVWLDNVKRATITGCTFSENNRGEAPSPDIQLVNCSAVATIGNNFGAPFARTTKAKIYTEDAASVDNSISYNVLEYDYSGSIPGGHYYDSSLYSVQSTAWVQNNLPDLAWPQTWLLTKGSNYQIVKQDLFNQRTIAASNNTTMTLPSAGSVHAGDRITIKNVGSGTVTVATTSSQTIDGAASIALTQYQSVSMFSNGSAWFLTSRVS